MKMRIVDVLDAMGGLTNVINANRPGMQAKASFRLGLLRRKLMAHYESANEVIQKKVREYDYRAPIRGLDTMRPGTMAEAGQEENYTIPPAKKIEHQAWWQEWSSEVVDVEGIDRVTPLSLFLPKKKGDPFTLSTSEIVLMGPLLEDDLDDGVEFAKPEEEGDKLAA